MHLQPVFEGRRTRGGDISTEIFDKGLCLPSGTALTPADQHRVIDVILKTGKI